MSRRLYLVGRINCGHLTHLAVLLLARPLAPHRGSQPLGQVGPPIPKGEADTAIPSPSRTGDPPTPAPTLTMDPGVPVRGTRKARTLGTPARERHRQTPDHLPLKVHP